MQKDELKRLEAAVLIGGKSVRMNGIPKFSLKNAEGISFLQLQLQALSSFNRICLSAAGKEQMRQALDSIGKDSQHGEIISVFDTVPDAGPIGGIYSILKAIQGEWVFVTACDMPYLSSALPEKLAAFLDSEEWYDCIICQDSAGRIHPLCGYYRKSVLPVIEELLRKKDYRMMHLLIRSRCRVVDALEEGIDDEIFRNVNTARDVLNEGLQGQKVLCICGVKNSGKTTYIEKLVKRLVSGGKKVAVIKHDGHDFEGDRPETDTFRFHEAGAMGTAIYSSQRYMLNVDAQTEPEWLAGQFPEADVILIEGMKHSRLPKIELIRSGVSDEISCNRENLMAVVTDLEKDFGEIDKWSFDEEEKTLKVIDICHKY